MINLNRDSSSNFFLGEFSKESYLIWVGIGHCVTSKPLQYIKIDGKKDDMTKIR